MIELLKHHWWKFLPAILLLAIASLQVVQFFAPEDVLAVKLKREDVVVTLTITGEVEADNTVSITAPMQARIESITVDDSDSITRGQFLVVLNKDEMEASLEQARAKLNQAHAHLNFIQQGTRKEELSRLRASVAEAKDSLAAARSRAEQAERFKQRMDPLIKTGAISQNEYDEALTKRQETQAEVNAAKARLAQAEELLRKAEAGYTAPEVQEAQAAVVAAQREVQRQQGRMQDYILTSPLDGVVLYRYQEPGDIAQPNAPILKIADQKTLEITGYLEEADLARVEKGDQVYVILDAHPGKAIDGNIVEIGSEVNPENGTVEVKIALGSETNITLLPGMTADINIVTDELRDAIVVPATAIYKTSNQLLTYVIEGTEIVEKPVQAKRVSLEYYQIFEGLAPGDWVVRSADPQLLEKGRVAPKTTHADSPKPPSMMMGK